MRLAIGIACITLVSSPHASAQPAGPSGATLAWWQAPSRGGTLAQLPGWVERVGGDGTAVLIGHAGSGQSLIIVSRLSVAGIVRGLPVTGEIMVAGPADGAPPPAGDSRSAWVSVGAKDNAAAEKLLEQAVGPLRALSPKVGQIGGVPVIRGALGEGSDQVCWSIAEGRLVFATTERAFARAAGKAGEGEPDLVAEDFAGMRRAHAQRHPDSLPVFMLYLSVNAWRHDSEAAFAKADAPGSRLLAAWKLSNARGLAVCACMTNPAEAGPSQPVFLGLDAGFSARCDPPGTATCVPLTLDALNRAQEILRIPDAPAQIVLTRDLREVLDWIVRTHRAMLNADQDKEFSKRWQAWLARQRALLSDTGEQVRPTYTIGFSGQGADEPRSDQAVLPFRIGVRTGVQTGLVGGRLAVLARELGSIDPPADRPAGPWIVPIDLPWLHGRIAWADRRTGDIVFISGGIAIGSGDPASVIPDLEPALAP